MNLPNVKTLKLSDSSYPEVLRHISSTPEQLFVLGTSPVEWLDKPKVAVVGSRRASPYGRQVTERLVSELAGVGVVIISGLALGIDSIAHQAALEANGQTVAVLPTPLDNIYPASHNNLAQNILSQGGTLISEYPPGSTPYKLNFIARNRIVSGLADILLITEAAVNSGTLHTARFALEQGKTVMAVPGNITSPGSEGCNNLIKSGAIPATDAGDIFFALGINPKKATKASRFKGSPDQQALLKLISSGIHSQEELALASKLDAASISSLLTMLEIAGVARSLGAGNWTLA
ncbi:DNA-protecting protein DprA [Candidatus Saccharibacteria bacterium CG10_big_fil_rev_8_21_14_0_10_47_8]|nr:MAG: DNA-protecting protein DprA [Candidatus Saccharibacteria bacterium CG10_big_fil_rev_8_21_14_0_10_47_8]